MANSVTKANPYRTFAVPDVILLATDLDSDIGYLLPHAIAQARVSGASLILGHVVPPAEMISLDARAVSSADAWEIEREANRTLDDIAIKIRKDGVACEVVVRRGAPTEIIPELVKTTGANRLILGTHGRRHLKRLVLGSVANRILHKVDIPVCTIGPHVTSISYGEPKKILHPTSLGEGDEQSARTALEIAQYYRAEITLLHVLVRDVHREYESDRVEQWTRADLERLIPEEASLWITSTIQVEVGTVVEQILNVAGTMHADLLVLGTGSDTSFWPLNDDNTAYEIIAQATCPVLTLRRPLPTAGAEVERENVAHLWAG